VVQTDFSGESWESFREELGHLDVGESHVQGKLPKKESDRGGDTTGGMKSVLEGGLKPAPENFVREECLRRGKARANSSLSPWGYYFENRLEDFGREKREAGQKFWIS